MPSPTQRPGLDSDAEKDTTYRVKWDPSEPANPFNWSPLKKASLCFLLGMLALCGSLASSIIAPAQTAIATEFGISQEVVVLNVALYVLGFAVGPSLWGPISELYGRRWSLLPALYCLALFSIGSGFAKTPSALFATRLFGGIFGAAPVSNVSAALGDMYEARSRGTAMAFYAICVVGGPSIGPIIGAALVTNDSLGWKWTEYITAIWVTVSTTVAVFCLPEMYGPVLLGKKAIRLRKETGDDRWWHPHEAETADVVHLLHRHLSRPLIMLTTEPTVIAIALYASFVYGLLYMTLEIFPIVFGEIRGWSPVVSTLPFLGLFIGICCAVFINLANQPRYIRAVEKAGGSAVPEARLPPMLIGGILFVAGLFWFGWTADPRFHWAIPVVAAGFIGAGFNIIFQQCLNVLVDSYGLYAASATSANTILRSLLACGLPLAARPMFQNLGVGPAMSVLGGVAALALPVPFVFMKYGKKLRSMSKFSPVNKD